MRNAGFLMDFLLGTGRTERKYREDDPQTLDLLNSPGADYLRDRFFEQGCQSVARIGYSTPPSSLPDHCETESHEHCGTSRRLRGFGHEQT